MPVLGVGLLLGVLLLLGRNQPGLYQETVARLQSHAEDRKHNPEVARLLKYIGAVIRNQLSYSLPLLTSEDKICFL